MSNNAPSTCKDCGGPSWGIRCEPCFEAQPVTAQGFSIAQLRAAFETVANHENWKLPVCCAIAETDRELVAEAIPYFTGSVAYFQPLADGTGLQVTADGYYEAVGA